jgi:hypothetical protein
MNPHVNDPMIPMDQAFPAPPASATEADQVAEDLGDDDFHYNPIPPRRSFTVVVHYRFLGRGQPLPYDLEEEEAE